MVHMYATEPHMCMPSLERGSDDHALPRRPGRCSMQMMIDPYVAIVPMHGCSAHACICPAAVLVSIRFAGLRVDDSPPKDFYVGIVLKLQIVESLALRAGGLLVISGRCRWTGGRRCG